MKITQELEADAGIFTAAYRDKITRRMNGGDDSCGRFVFDDEIDKFLLASFDVIKVEKLAKTMEVKFLKELKLFVVKVADFNDEGGATSGFVVADSFDHAEIKSDGMEKLFIVRLFDVGE